MIQRRYSSYNKKPATKRFRTNQYIRAQEVMLIDEDGSNLGNKSIEAALAMARERDIDLIEVSPKAVPPVCRLMEYGKWQYLQSQKIKKQKNLETKAIRLTFKIGEHDAAVRAKQANKFLEKGHKVKIELQLRGRERAFAQQAKDHINEFIKQLNDARTEQEVDVQGGRLSAIVSKKG